MIDRAPPNTPSNLPAIPQPGGLPFSAPRISGGSARPPQGDDADAVPWTRYLDALRRNWWIIALVLAVGSAGGVYVARNQALLFAADAKIWINPNASARYNGPIGTGQLLSSSSWVTLMKSSPVTTPVVLKLGLNSRFAPEDSAFNGTMSFDTVFTTGMFRVSVDANETGYTLTRMADTSVVERGTLGDSIGRSLGFRWAPRAEAFALNRVVDFGVGPTLLASGALQGNLRDRLEQENGQFLLLSYEHTNPRQAALILNEWIKQFVAIATDLKTRKQVEVKTNLQEQVDVVRRQLDANERVLADFQKRTISLPGADVIAAIPLAGTGRGGAATPPPAGPQQAYLQATLSADALKTSRIALEKIMADARGGPVSRTAILRVPGVLVDSPELQKALDSLVTAEGTLRMQQSIFTDSAEGVVKARARVTTLERDTIPSLIRSIIASHSEQERRLSTQIGTQYQELQQIPERTLQYSRLVRQVQSSQLLWDQLNSNLEAAKLAEAQITPDLTILQLAEVPPFPTSNQGPRLLFLAVVASFAAAVGLALLRDKMDRRFRYPEQATNELGLLIAGTVPRFRLNRKRQLSVTAMSQVVESFRTLRLAVRHHFPVEQPVVLAVSSPGPGDGKSIVSSNLAVAFANAGHKTLLIDGDVRRGVVHDTFDIARRPGLVDYLAGTASAAAIVRTTSTENLSVIPSGSRSRRAPELLVSERMNALISTMREQFEVVIVDSPPFVAGVDAFALAASAGTMLVVLRPGITDRKLASMKLEIIDRLPVSVIGAVLNGVGNNGAYRYYYSDYTYAAADESPSGLDELGEPIEAPSTPRLLSKK
ncbi:MAG TPA: polysaccharide biosynthesis tyrosine autokinase [Gemmatimonadaceae bacterium]|nr:polysaccharide biosynthesis tyrosine autokinase [Gemmatimonadaceae bacterium]